MTPTIDFAAAFAMLGDVGLDVVIPLGAIVFLAGVIYKRFRK